MQLENYIPFAVSIARQKFSKSYHLQLEDLISVAYLGLVKAFNSFDSKRGVPFIPYAKIRISGEILDFLEKELKFKKLMSVSIEDILL